MNTPSERLENGVTSMTTSNGQRRAVLVALGMVATALVTTSAAAAPPRETLTSTVRALGGPESGAVDIDGTVVVGSADTPTGHHAFAYDLSTSTMRDLGTLGGAWAQTTAIDGSIVVGTSQTASGEQHAFAFDLSVPGATMRDLGTLGGTFSNARDVSGHVVVGESSLSPYGTRGFVFDLAAPGASMRGLESSGIGSSRALAIDGNLVVGGAARAGSSAEQPFVYDLASASPSIQLISAPGSRFGLARAVRGHLVVGDATTAAGDDHAFVYDAGAAAPAPKDLGTLGGRRSIATAVDGTIVAGSSETSDGTDHAFAVDVAAAAPRLRDLGSLGGRYAVPSDVSGQLVVGGSSRAGDQRTHAFAYDLSSADPRMVDLGVPPGSTTSSAAAASGRTVVGTLDLLLGRAQAAVWTIRPTAAPAVRFGRTRYAVHESRGRATVTVVRAGDPSRPVSVRYSTAGITARSGQDFASRSGALRFAAGQTSRTFSVPVLSDTRMEKAETVMVRLSSPSSGALLGTPNVAAVLIRASDQRVDAGMDVRRRASFFGNNVYNTTGARQTKSLAGSGRYDADPVRGRPERRQRHQHGRPARRRGAARGEGPLLRRRHGRRHDRAAPLVARMACLPGAPAPAVRTGAADRRRRRPGRHDEDAALQHHLARRRHPHGRGAGCPRASVALTAPVTRGYGRSTGGGRARLRAPITAALQPGGERPG